jgi:alpha-beta hydrolase superfamily lysophospholipase
MPPGTITTTDGIPLAVDDRTLPAPRARVVVVHGYAEHLGRYDEFVSRLEARNFECHRYDLRGHGHSGGIPAHVARFDEYVDDLRLVIDRVRSADRPFFVVGHSLGGLIALETIRRLPQSCDGLAVSSPFLRTGFEVSRTQKVLASIASRVAPTLSLETGLQPEMVSNDPEVVASYATDPLVRRRTTPRWFTEVEGAQVELCGHAEEVVVPFLMLLGEDDQIADHILAADVFERIGSPDKTLKKYPGMRHEVFNETERSLVYEDLITWLEARSLPR